MILKPTKITSVIQCTLFICIFALLIFCNTGCSSCNNEDAKKKSYDDGYIAGESVGYSRGHKVGYEEGHTIGYGEGYKRGDSDGYSRGHKVGHKEGHKKGYQEGTSAFLGKWWKPSLGMVIIALILVFTFTALYYILKKPTKRLITQLETQTENYLNQKKLNKKLEQEIKLMEEREKHRFTLRVQALYESACLSLNEKENQASLERLIDEAKKSIQKAQINELEEIVSNYEEKFRMEETDHERQIQKETPNPKFNVLQPTVLKALPEGRA